MIRISSSGLFLLAACASTQSLPPGDELEHPVAPVAEEAAPPSQMPKASDAELASAWEPARPRPPPPGEKGAELEENEESAARGVKC